MTTITNTETELFGNSYISSVKDLFLLSRTKTSTESNIENIFYKATELVFTDTWTSHEKKIRVNFEAVLKVNEMQNISLEDNNLLKESRRKRYLNEDIFK